MSLSYNMQVGCMLYQPVLVRTNKTTPRRTTTTTATTTCWSPDPGSPRAYLSFFRIQKVKSRECQPTLSPDTMYTVTGCPPPPPPSPPRLYIHYPWTILTGIGKHRETRIAGTYLQVQVGRYVSVVVRNHANDAHTQIRYRQNTGTAWSGGCVVCCCCPHLLLKPPPPPLLPPPKYLVPFETNTNQELL